MTNQKIWDLLPGSAIGPYSLESDINSVVREIMKERHLNEAAKIIMDEKSTYESDIIVVIDEYSIILTFDSLSQRLARISARASQTRRPSIPALALDGKVVMGPEVQGDCRRVVSVFPPTTLGTFCLEDLSYLMQFKNGLEVKLNIADEDMFRSFQQKREHPIAVGEYSPSIESIDIFSMTAGTHGVESLPRFEVVPLEGVRFYAVREKQAAWISLGCGLQDVISVLGTPEDVSGDMYNFFNQGVDVQVDTSSFCSVKKIILHFNIPGHALFGRYSRCWFDLSLGGTDKRISKSKPLSEDVTISINNKSKLGDFTAVFGDAGQPLVVNNSRCATVRYFYTFARGLVGEFTPGGTLACLEISINP